MLTTAGSLSIAVLGDLHACFDAEDVRQLDAAGYDLILFVGDLAGLRLRSTLAIAEVIAALATPTLVVPGNHDAPNAVQLLGEILHSSALIRWGDRDTEGRADAIAAALGDARLAGYSAHRLTPDLEILAGRPHSMGGDELSFAPFLERRFGVTSIEESAQRLCALVDAAEAPNLLFVAHNGPSGLGSARDSIWGCDFRKEEGDFGDKDLELAVKYAAAQGKRVVGVVAGHMHVRLRGGGERTTRVERDGTLFLNAARVPRIWNDADGRSVRHHLALRWAEGALTAEEVLW